MHRRTKGLKKKKSSIAIPILKIRFPCRLMKTRARCVSDTEKIEVTTTVIAMPTNKSGLRAIFCRTPL